MAIAALACCTPAKGVKLAGIGVVVALLLSAGVAKLLTAAFLGLAMSDTVPFAAGSLGLGTAAVLASWRVARRAARIDPMARSGVNERSMTKPRPEPRPRRREDPYLIWHSSKLPVRA
jgi:hypothetical protein